jgi:hypothetical protein
LIENISETEKLQYQGWSGETLGDSHDAGLVDDAGNAYKLVNSGATGAGEHQARSINPSQAISDVLVFEAPADRAKSLRLTLPGGAYGGHGQLHLKIPAYAIQRSR